MNSSKIRNNKSVAAINLRNSYQLEASSEVVHIIKLFVICINGNIDGCFRCDCARG